MLKKSLVFTVLLSALFVVGLQAAVLAEKACESGFADVRVMTYNIRVGVGGAAERLPAEEGLEKVARIVEQCNPDVLLIQEIEKGAKRSGYVDEVTWLMRRLDYPHAAFGPAIREATWNYGVAIFSRYPSKVSSQRTRLFKPDYRASHPEYPAHYSEQRVLLRATTLVQGATVNFFCTHLGLTPDQRKRQVEEIVERLEGYASPCVLGGDFNALPDSAEMEPLRVHLQDALDAFSVPVEKRLSYPAKKPKRAIDAIFVSQDIEVRSAKVIADETLASDHLPVLVELRIPLE